ncbi:hypothetical protein HELRODRAFT_92165, partial [Helobdella robusta]|uniref:Homeobox domain-containing protein n=1 Tax=Helobdella robusta TaxID=6412 RepID=T1G8C6_HELRO
MVKKPTNNNNSNNINNNSNNINNNNIDDTDNSLDEEKLLAIGKSFYSDVYNLDCNNTADIDDVIINNNNNDIENINPTTTTTTSQQCRCGSCGEPIFEEHLLKVGGFNQPWHVSCLKCCVCQQLLADDEACYCRANNIYCKDDYSNHRLVIVVVVAASLTTLLLQLSTGEEFALHDDKLLCKLHFVEMVVSLNASDAGQFFGGKFFKKFRSFEFVFAYVCLRILHANFRVDSNPDGQDLERIAHQTGLSKRVTQVWFQNSRARQKKH